MEKIITKKSFIGGRLVHPGEKVDLDDKGVVLPAPSTPVGSISTEDLKAILKVRMERERSAEGSPRNSPEGAPAASEEVVGAAQADPLDHDGDGRKGGSKPRTARKAEDAEKSTDG